MDLASAGLMPASVAYLMKSSLISKRVAEVNATVAFRELPQSTIPTRSKAEGASMLPRLQLNGRVFNTIGRARSVAIEAYELVNQYDVESLDIESARASRSVDGLPQRCRGVLDFRILKNRRGESSISTRLSLESI
jgi:hypothetical protein